MISFKNIIYINTRISPSRPLTFNITGVGLFAPEAGVQSSESENKLECAQCSAVQLSAVQCSSVQCSSVQCSAVQFSSVQCIAIQCS